MSQQGNRLVYRNAVKSLIRAGVDPQKAVLSQSYLRFEQVVASGKTQYNFGVLQNDSGNSGVAVRPTEQRLALQDSFYTSSVQVLLSNPGSTTSTSFPLFSFPSLATMGANWANYYNLYSGSLQLSVNNKTLVTAWDAMRHYQSNQTQQSVFPPSAATPGTTLNQFNGGQDGAYDCEPNWVLIGSKNNSLSISLPNAITPTGTNTEYLVIILRGVLAQNVTVVS
jgi:hypothetical protein